MSRERQGRRAAVSSQTAVLKIEQAADAPAGRYRFEEAGSGLVGVDAGGRQQTDDAVRLDQVHGALDEERVEVDVAATQQRVVAAVAYQLAETVGAQLGRVKRRTPEDRQLFAQLFDPPTAGVRGRGPTPVAGERVANHSTSCSLMRSQGGLPITTSKAAHRLVVLPVRARRRGRRPPSAGSSRGRRCGGRRATSR